MQLQTAIDSMRVMQCGWRDREKWGSPTTGRVGSGNAIEAELEKEEGGVGGLGDGDSRSKGPEVVGTSYTQEL